MRLLKLGIYHATYLQNFYAARPPLKAQSYRAQHRALIDDGFGSADFWTSALEKLNYETTDLIANAEFLQKAWARENDFKFDEDKWLFEIAAAQIKKFRPAILLVADYSTLTADFLKNIRRECPSIRLILGWCGAPYRDLSVMREWDVALSCVPEMVAAFRAEGLQSHHVNHAFAPRILSALDTESPPDIDFAFIGSVLRQNQFHVEREKLLLRLVEQTNLQIWSDLKKPSFSLCRKISGIFTRRTDRAAEVDNRLAARTHPPVFGLEMFQQLRRARVVFNNHIDISPTSASNMRLFETTGTGTCLITDWKKNLPELFEPDTEVLTYASAEECIEKVRYLLDHETARQTIAAAGQRRTLQAHTFANRAARIDEIIRQSLTSTT
jgi:spore maturation protein CgeB